MFDWLWQPQVCHALLYMRWLRPARKRAVRLCYQAGRECSLGGLPPWVGEQASCQSFDGVWLVQASPSSSAAQQVLPDGPEPVVFEVEYTPTEQLEPLEDAEAQSKVRSLKCCMDGAAPPCCAWVVSASCTHRAPHHLNGEAQSKVCRSSECIDGMVMNGEGKQCTTA